MADIIQDLKDLEVALADIVCSATSLPSDKVLTSYTRHGKPAIDNGTSIAYVAVVPQDGDDSAIYINRTKEYNSVDQTFKFTQQSNRALKLSVVFYGPNALVNAIKTNQNLYFQDTKIMLSSLYLAIIPDKTSIHRVPEQFNGQWWERADLEVSFYNTILVENIVQKFESFIINIETEVE